MCVSVSMTHDVTGVSSANVMHRAVRTQRVTPTVDNVYVSSSRQVASVASVCRAAAICKSTTRMGVARVSKTSPLFGMSLNCFLKACAFNIT